MKNIYEKIEKSKKTGEIEFFIKERSDDCVISTMPVKEGILNPRNGKRVKVVRTRVTGNADRLLADVTTTHMPAM